MARLVNPGDVAFEQLDQLYIGLNVFGKKLVNIVKNPRIDALLADVHSIFLGMA